MEGWIEVRMDSRIGRWWIWGGGGGKRAEVDASAYSTEEQGMLPFLALIPGLRLLRQQTL